MAQRQMTQTTAVRTNAVPAKTYSAEELLSMAETLAAHSKGPAIEQLVAQRDRIDYTLKLLGYDPPVTTPGPERSEPTARNSADFSGQFCGICNIEGHDGRAHRHQHGRKKPLTKYEQQDLEKIRAKYLRKLAEREGR